MRISRAKIDAKGRLQLPSHFLMANLITKNTWVDIDVIYNNKHSVKLTFKTSTYYNDRTKEDK